MPKDFKRFICMLLAVLMCLSLLTAAMASGELDDASEAETEAESAEETVPAEETPAEDGSAYYEKERLSTVVPQKVYVQSWAYAERESVSLTTDQSSELRVIVDADRQDKMTYQWFRTLGWNGETELLEDETGPVCAVSYQKGYSNATYSCIATWDDEEEAELRFNVYFYSSSASTSRLYAYPEGTDRTTWSKRVQADYGSDVTLRVCVEDSDGVSVADQVTGRWTMNYIDNGKYNYQELNETGTSITIKQVDRSATFRYEVQSLNGEYAGYASAQFQIEINNDLSLQIRHSMVADYEYDLNGRLVAGFTVSPGEPISVKAIASARNTEGLTGVWQDYGADGEPEPTSGSDLTWEYVNRSPRSGSLLFTLTDAYGNTRAADLVIQVKNDLAFDRIVPTGGVTTYEYDHMYGDHLVGIKVNPGEPLTLEPIIKAKDADGLTYSWRDSRLGSIYGPEGEENVVETSIYSLESVDKAGTIYLTVMDKYNNRMRAEIRILLDNGFAAAPEGAEPGRHEVEIQAEVDGTYRLKAIVEANDASKLTYSWGCITQNGGWTTFRDASSGTGYIIEPDPGVAQPNVPADADRGLSGANELIVEHLPETMTYYCSVSDGYGNEQTLYFHLNIDGDRYGTGGRRDPLDANGDGVEDASDAAIFIGRKDILEAFLALQKLVGIRIDRISRMN